MKKTIFTVSCFYKKNISSYKKVTFGIYTSFKKKQQNHRYLEEDYGIDFGYIYTPSFGKRNRI